MDKVIFANGCKLTWFDQLGWESFVIDACDVIVRKIQVLKKWQHEDFKDRMRQFIVGNLQMSQPVNKKTLLTSIWLTH